MYLHLGQDTVITTKSIIGIFDMDRCTVSKKTRDYLTEAEKKGNVVNVSIDEDYLDENGKIDVDKMEIIAFDMVNNTYRVLGENVGKAFKDGFDL